MKRTVWIYFVVLVLSATNLYTGDGSSYPVNRNDKISLEQGFRLPPKEARPSVYWLWLNGYVNEDYLETELRRLADMGISGVCLFEMGTRGPEGTIPPTGPAFMSDSSVSAIARAVEIAGELNMDVQLAVCSSWDMGGTWVQPDEASMGLYYSDTTVTGPAELNAVLPFPDLPAASPRKADGTPVFSRDVAVLAMPVNNRLPGHEFVFRLPFEREEIIDHVVLYNTESEEVQKYGEKHLFSKTFSVSVSIHDERSSSFREVCRGELVPDTSAQRFDFPATSARFVRLQLFDGYNTEFNTIQLAEFEAYSTDGRNVVASNIVDRTVDSAELLRFSSEKGQNRSWRAENIHDGKKSGAAGSWQSAGLPPLFIDNISDIFDLTARLEKNGRINWEIPEGEWLIQRFVCGNTGELLKVPSPASDGLATDHFNAKATRNFLDYLIKRLQTKIPDLEHSALEQLYLPSYEVRGSSWTPDFLEKFAAYRGYDMTTYLPALSGCVIGDDETTDRFIFDYRKTQGDLLVDAYYREASQTARQVGLGIEAEAGGPGPPVHRVPVDALKALGAIDEMRGEFWPRRPNRHQLWIVKETACAAHIYGRRRVHMEAFTSMHHWQDTPLELKSSADRAFCAGANHFVWHTSSHQPPEAGKPGWVYHAGTHFNSNLIWWPMAKPFVDYLARCSYLLQQGRFVADVCYYYGDQAFNFVPARELSDLPEEGYDYDVINAEALLTRMTVKDNRLFLPDGMSYRILVLPDRDDIDFQVLRKIEQLIVDGAVVVGRRPTRSSGLAKRQELDTAVDELAAKIWGDCDGINILERKYGKGRIIWRDSVPAVLKSLNIERDFSYKSQNENAELDFIHRTVDDKHIYFIRNKRQHAENADVSLRVTGYRPELWFPESGEIRKPAVFRQNGGFTTLPLQLPSEGSVFVVFREAAVKSGVVSITHSNTGDKKPVQLEAGSAAVSEPEPGKLQMLAFSPGVYNLKVSDQTSRSVKVEQLPAVLELNQPWQVDFSQSIHPAGKTVFPDLISWTEHDNPDIRFFSGIAVYNSGFEISDEWSGDNSKVFLDLGDLWSVAEVILNGTHVGILWKPPYRLDVSDMLRTGRNELTIRIANSWSNRLVGDAISPNRNIRSSTNIVYNNGVAWRDMPLIPSGLFGPVRLIPAAVVMISGDD